MKPVNIFIYCTLCVTYYCHATQVILKCVCVPVFIHTVS